MARILLLGATGQVGRELQSALAVAPWQVINAGRDADLTQTKVLRQLIQSTQPNLIINAAAYTSVDKAEIEPDLAKTVNEIAPKILSEAAQQVGATLLHLSTDYVFDGSQSHPYQETDLTNPLGVYGQSKLAGEIALQSIGGSYVILRTAWVYGTHGKNNFVKTMLRLGAEREELRVVADQIGAPTWAKDLADAIVLLALKLTPETAEIYHYTNSGVASWYDFAVAIFEEARLLGFPLKVRQVIPISTAEYPTPARRPSYSVLSCAKIAAVLGTYPPHWRQGLRRMLEELYTHTYESADSLRR